VRDVVRTALRDREAVLHAVADDELAPDLAAAYRESYRWQARREARDRRIDATTERLINILFYAGLFLLFVQLVVRASSGWLAAVFYFGGWFTGFLALRGLTSLLRRLPSGLQVVVYGCGTAGTAGGLYLLWREAGSADALLDVIATDMWRIALTGFSLVPVVLFGLMAPILGPANWLQARSVQRAQPRLALLTELFALAHALSNPRALDDQSLLLRKLDNAAVVLETHFWKQI
jgi:hypothetical protein